MRSVHSFEEFKVKSMKTIRDFVFRFAMAYLSVASILPTATAISHGDKGHDHDVKMATHMQVMYALKEKIPEEYKIMERTPLFPTDQSLAQGKEAFNLNCTVCHGSTGRGNGPAAKGMHTSPADFLDLQHSATYGPGEKFWIISNGSGATGMPAFSQIDLRTRWNIVNYIIVLQESKPMPQDDHHQH